MNIKSQLRQEMLKKGDVVGSTFLSLYDTFYHVPSSLPLVMINIVFEDLKAQS